MADITYSGTISGPTGLSSVMAGWSCSETAAAVAIVKIRDGFKSLGACTLADGAAGNSTAGLHYAVATVVTANGESVIGAYPAAAGFTSAGTTILNVTVPVYAGSGNQSGDPSSTRDQITGRNVYLTKAGAPATNIIPTNAQWFLPVANPSTTLTAANNLLPLVAAGGRVGLVLTSATGFNAGPAWASVATNMGTFPVLYQSIVGSTLTTCTFPGYVPAQALMATSGAVTQAALPDNTSTTLAVNVADASFTATHPPLIDVAGSLLSSPAQFAAVTGGSTQHGTNTRKAIRNGQLYVEVTSGTVSWSVWGS